LSENPHLPFLFTPLMIILIVDLDKAMDMYSPINNSFNNDKEALGVAVVLKVFQLAGGHSNQPLNHGGRFSNYDHASDTICITYFRCGGPNHKADGCMLCNWRGHWTVRSIYCLADGWHYGWYLVSWYCKVLKLILQIILLWLVMVMGCLFLLLLMLQFQPLVSNYIIFLVCICLFSSCTFLWWFFLILSSNYLRIFLL